MLVVTFALSAGCNAVVNFDDFEFHPDDGKKDSGTEDSGPGDKDSGSNVSCEKQVEDCSNDLDDDCDHLRDCKDPDCASDQMCCVPNQIPETSCSDGVDNDCDGHMDCTDTDCAASALCCSNPVAEVGAAACKDNVDNDCDGLTDCKEGACSNAPNCCNATGEENTPAACSDATDNDCDGKKNCLDSDCVTTSACCTKSPSNATTETSCVDDLDNDCDGKVDCQDPDCDAINPCANCVKSADTETSCTDAVDNDCDKDRDCRDSDCAGTLSCCVKTGSENTPDACSDDGDNDCDGLMDCADPDCMGQFNCCVAAPEDSSETCSDSIDNDCDGLLNCLDPSCASTDACCTKDPSDATSETSCDDNIDNDCDGKIDCQDDACATASSCAGCVKTETSETSCNDNIDNDCDTNRDCRDPDCAGTLACCVNSGSENTASACIDGTDNDCDGLKDCADPDCTGQLSCCVAVPENTPGTCSDSIDNDCDGVKDCSDSGCSGQTVCCGVSGSGTTLQGAGACCVSDGMTDAAAPNDGKDNECNGTLDRPVLMSAFPTQGLPSAADEVRLKFAPEIIPSATLSCWTHRLNNTTPDWKPCPMNGTEVQPFTSDAASKPENNGVWVTDVRWAFQTGEFSEVYTFKYYVHSTLYRVGHCPQPHTDMQWFSKAAERLASASQGTFSPGVDTFLASPFIRVRYKIPMSTWADWKLDGSSPDIEMPSLRRRFTLSPDNKYLLITRNYTSTRSGTCAAGTIRVHNTQMMSGPRNNSRFITYSCRAIVLNRAGVGVCMNEGASGPVFPIYSESNEVFANALGWPKANKFMWRIFIDRKTDGPVNFTKKCVQMPCTNGGIFLPDRQAFPPAP